MGALVSMAQTQRSDLGSGSDTKFAFAWQLVGRVGYDLTQNLSVGGFYKILSTPDTEFGGDVQLSLDGGYTQAIGLYLNWKF